DCVPESGEAPRLSCTLPEAVQALEVGQPVLFDDGAIAAEVVSIDEVEGTGADGEPGTFLDARLKVTRAKPGGQNLAGHKGINLPTTDLPFSSLTEEDEEHLRFVVENADDAAVSFIRHGEDVDHVLSVLEDIAAGHETAGNHELAERSRDIGIVLKIETIPAFASLPNLL